MIQRGKEPALEPIEDESNLAALAELLAAQARGLNRVFARAVQDMLLGRTRSFRDVGRALKAQNQCRIALRVLIALRAAMEAQKKSRNRTNELLKDENRHQEQDVGQATSEPRSCPDKAYPQELVARMPGEAGRTHLAHDLCPPQLQRKARAPSLPGEARRAKPGHSIDIGPATRALIPSGPANNRGIASPAASRRPWMERAPRRRWRIAS
jgi:hypothetical protein